MRIYFWNGCQPILKVSTLKGVIRGHQNDENWKFASHDLDWKIGEKNWAKTKGLKSESGKVLTSCQIRRINWIQSIEAEIVCIWFSKNQVITNKSYF